MTTALSLTAYQLRPETDGDRNYVLFTWRWMEEQARRHAEGAYFSTLQSGEMHGILARESTRVTIACAPTDQDVILGWSCTRPPAQVIRKGPSTVLEIGPAPILYFVFVRKEVRRLGIANLLLAELLPRRDVLYTTRPSRVRDESGRWFDSPIERKTPPHWRYCPRAAFVEVP